MMQKDFANYCFSEEKHKEVMKKVIHFSFSGKILLSLPVFMASVAIFLFSSFLINHHYNNLIIAAVLCLGLAAFFFFGITAKNLIHEYYRSLKSLG